MRGRRPDRDRSGTVGRRALLAGAAALAATSAAAGGASAAGLLPPAARARLGVTTVSFRDRYRPRLGGVATAGGESLLTAPQFIRDRLGLTHFEVWSLQFEDEGDEYCDRLRAAAAAAGGRIVNVQLDGRYDLSSADEAEWARSLEFVKSWMDRARRLGAPSVRANFSGLQAAGPFPAERVIEAFRRLAAYGRAIGVRILAENHIGHSLPIDNVVTVLEAVNDPWCRAIADWGNSPAKDLDERVAQLRRLGPWLDLVSAKAMRFDAQGRHLDYDLGALTRATEAAGFRGLYSVELFSLNSPPADPVAAALGVATEIAANLGPPRSRT